MKYTALCLYMGDSYAVLAPGDSMRLWGFDKAITYSDVDVKKSYQRIDD